MKVERIIARGRFLPGFLISLPTNVVSIHPSYAHSTDIIAKPNGPITWPNGALGHSGRKFALAPPGNTNAPRINTASAIILRNVSTFWVVAPSLTSRQFSRVSPQIDAIATA